MATKYKDAPCPACGSPTKRKFEPGSGKRARMQHPKWWVCERGHQIVRKRGQV